MPTVINIVEDEPQSTEEEILRRRSVCSSCDQYNSEQDTCNACGCLVERKVLYVDDTCPEGKW